MGVARAWLCALWVIAGCQTEIRGKDATRAPDVDGDADTDTDLDNPDTGTVGDTAETGDTAALTSELDCDADYASVTPDPGSAGLGTCVTQELTCGDRILGALTGGSTVYDYTYWEQQGVLGPYLGDYDFLDGPERVYVFRGLAQGETVEVRVQTCFDSWATWVRYGDLSGDFCTLDPFDQAGVFEIGAARDRSTQRINPSSASGYDFEFQIEGIDGAEGNFLLTVTCPR